MKLNFIQLAVVVAATAFVVSCSGGSVKVTVSNPADFARTDETVEINLSDLKGIAAETAIVTAEGRQIPCQVYTDASGVEKLLFQVSLEGGGQAQFEVANGQREEFPVRAYSRYVPERLDDYAYENNLVAGRIYGPALEDPRTFGSDIWIKSTDRLIVDEWFKKNDYHHNYGEGMDCYKVSNTLGGGAFAPVGKDGELVLGDNYASFTHICDGPIRTEAVFEYPEFDLDGRKVSATRVLSLDANSRFVKSVVTYHGEMNQAPVALAAVRHDVISGKLGDNWVAFTEKASDTDDPERDGDISVGLVYDNADGDAIAATDEIGSHAGIVIQSPKGNTFTGWTGSGWSQGGIATPKDWEAEVAGFAARVACPLKVTVK